MKNLWSKFKESDFYKTFKEELSVGPILFVGFYFLNKLLLILFPNGAYFDFFSEIETLVGRVIFLFVSVWTSHLLLRVFFPQIYKSLHEEVYHTWMDIPEEKRKDYAIKFILVLILSGALVFSSRGADVRTQLVEKLHTQLNVREISPNKAPMIDKYLASVGVYTPAAWCAAFVSWNMQQFNIPNPKSAWSPNYALSKDVIWKPKIKTSKQPLQGDVATYYYSNLGRVGHVGYYISTDKDGYFITIEGNTNGTGSREGDGVYKKKRDKNKVYAITRYIK